MNRASAVCTSVCRARTLQRAVATMKKKTRFNFSFLWFCCAVCCCCFVSITPSSKLGTLRQPWCNSSSISRYSLYGSHERYFCACACRYVFVCHPGPNLDDCNPHIHRISKAPVQYRHPNSNDTTNSELYIGSHVYISYARRNNWVPSFQLATPSGFQVNPIPKGNRV